MLRLEQPDIRIDVLDVSFGHFFRYADKVFMRVRLKSVLQGAGAATIENVVGIGIDGISVCSVDTNVIPYGHNGRKVLGMGRVVES